MEGNRDIGRVSTASAPRNTMIREITIANASPRTIFVN